MTRFIVTIVTKIESKAMLTSQTVKIRTFKQNN